MAVAATDRIGQRFGRAVVLQLIGRVRNLHRVRCLCDCGTEFETILSYMTYGDTTSCGCLKRERIKAANITHGLSRSAEYKIWAGMIKRCENENSKSYDDYGGRGIRVCDEWRTSFEAFVAHIGRRPSSSHSIDRIDNNGDYEPGNVRWALRKTQCQNRRTVNHFTFYGQTRCLTDWCEIAGINPVTVRARLRSGKWSPKYAVWAPIGWTGQKN